MLAPTYALQKDIDPNEAHGRLATALGRLELIEGVQQAIWSALKEKKPDLESAALVEHVQKKLDKPRRFKGLKPKRTEQGPMAALSVLIDVGASVSSGEAMGLLGTPEGERLLQEGFRVVGRHLADEMLR